MSTEQNKAEISEDEISLKELILKFREYFWYIISKWKILSLFVLLGLSFNLFNYFTHNPKFTATISFMINEDESSSLGGLGSLLGSVGGLLGGGASEYNLDKILEISKSDRIAEQILLKKCTINNKTDYIANHLIESKDTLDEWIHVSWYKKPLINYERKLSQRNHRFKSDSIDYSNNIETYVLKELIKVLFGTKSQPNSGIVSTEYGELTGIMRLSTLTYDQQLSLEITNSIFKELSDFYVIKSVEKQQQTFDLMKLKHDSINDLLNQKRYALAQFQDKNRGLFKISDKVKQGQYQTDVLIFSTALGEAKKNLEIADFALRDKTPFVQILDRPFLPLESSKPALFRSLLLGIILGSFIGVLIIILRKVYQDIMS